MQRPKYKIFGIKRDQRIEGKKALADYYSDALVVQGYERARFQVGRGRLKHMLDVDVVLEMLDAKTEQILDLGAGSGRISRALVHTERYRQIVAADYSWAMLQEARQYALQDKITLDIVNLDAFNLPFCALSFDAIVSFRFIRHLYPDVRSDVYGAVWEILKPGGQLIFDVCNYDQHKDQIATRGVYDELYTKDELTTEMDASGFEVENLAGTLYFSPRFFGLKKFGFSDSFLISLMRIGEKRIRRVNRLLPNAYLWIAKCRKITK